MPFIIRAAFQIVDRIRRLRQGLSGFRELPFDLRLRPQKKAIGFLCLRRHGADTADHHVGLLNVFASVGRSLSWYFK